MKLFKKKTDTVPEKRILSSAMLKKTFENDKSHDGHESEALRIRKQFTDLLLRTELREMFLEFTKKLMIPELMWFWGEAQMFQELAEETTQEEFSRVAKDIYMKYFDDNSETQIHLNPTERQALLKEVENNPTRTTFKQSQEIVFVELQRDAYPKFLKSDVYKKWLKEEEKRQKKVELLSNHILAF